MRPTAQEPTKSRSGRHARRWAAGFVALAFVGASIAAGVVALQPPPGHPSTALSSSPAGSAVAAASPSDPPASTVSFVAFGDAGENSPQQRALRDLMVQRASSYQLGIMVGDGAYPNGMLDEYTDNFFAVYGSLFQGQGQPLPQPTTGMPKPLYGTPGNHDYYGTPSAAGYRASFSTMPKDGPWGQLDYSFNIGNVHFVSIDSQYLTDQETLQKDKDDAKSWLIADLDQYRDQVTVVFDHHPAYTTGPHADTPEVLEVRNVWFALAAWHGADLFLSGHEHSYERNTPQLGLTSYVTGGGGAELSNLAPRSFTAASLVDWEYLEVKIAGCTISTDAVRIGGQTYDPWSYRAPTCTGAPAPPALPVATPKTILTAEFESGEPTGLSMAHAGEASAVVAQRAWASGSHVLQLTSTARAGSAVYGRDRLEASPSAVTISGDYDIGAQGAAQSNVPILRLFTSSGRELLDFYRQNGRYGRLYVERGGSYRATEGRVKLGQWFHVDLRVDLASPTRWIEIRLDGILIYAESGISTTNGSGVSGLEIGTETPGQAYRISIADLVATTP